MSLSVHGTQLQVSLSDAVAQASSGVLVTITDLQGRRIATITMAAGQRTLHADLSSLEAGAYMATLHSPGHQEAKKFIVY